MPTAATAVRARAAVVALFAVNGVLGAAWIGRLVDVQRNVGLDDAQLGLVLSVAAAGGLTFGLLAGPLAARWGSGRTAVVACLAYAPLTALVGLESSALALGLTLFWIAGMDAVMDASMNAHGIRVQKEYGRSILNSFHGWWSLGSVAGAGLAALSAALGLALAPYLLAVGVTAAAVVLVAGRFLLPAPDPETHLDPDDLVDVPEAGAVPAWRRAVTRGTVLLGVFIVLAVVVEDVPSRWSSVYLSAVGATGGLVSLGLVAFTSAQTVGRFVGDRLVDRFGDVAVTRWGMGATAVVLGAALVQGGTWAYVVACVVVGFGVAPLFPAAIHAAAHVPGVRPATGVAVVSWLSRVGFLAAPLVVGSLAEAYGIAWGIALAVVAAVALVPLASLLRKGS